MKPLVKVVKAQRQILVWSLTFFVGFAISANTNKSTEKSNCIRILNSGTAFSQAIEIQDGDKKQKYFQEQAPRQTLSSGAGAPIVHSFEKEGLYYEEIAHWFSILKPSAKDKLQAKFNRERNLPAPRRALHRWLSHIKKLEPAISTITPTQWEKAPIAKRLQLLMSLSDPFSALALKYKAALFDLEILNFDDIQAGPNAPALLTVGDDLGSYEVRMTRGVADRAHYLRLRAEVENFLEGQIGHQHLFHSWPNDPQLRAEMAPKYIELLDATTWYLFWRQMNRNPKDVSSTLAHQFLGVYTRSSLDRLYRAVIEGRPQKFKNKFRMVGARSFTANPDIPEQGTGVIPDWEIRSGNKGVKREFIETMLEARLSSGDYTGLQDYREVALDPSTSIAILMQPFLNEKQIVILKEFEARHPAMAYNTHTLAHNHIRNRILSPLLPWTKRLSIPLKEDLLKQEQEKYAQRLLQVAQKFLTRVNGSKKISTVALGEVRAEAVEELEEAIYAFSTRVRLDLDFEQYLTPVPAKTVNLDVVVNGPINVNEIPIGIEYSFRFPQKAHPRSRSQAAAYIRKFATKIKEAFGSDKSIIAIENGDSHGHGTSVKYTVQDTKGRVWRTEWDGISRYYVDGKIRRAWDGHVEVPTPKFVPHSIEDGISQLFSVSRAMKMAPQRFAGGGHFNVDIQKLMSEYPSEVVARGIANLISFFESNQELILFMWTHPLRMHAAYPVALAPGFKEKLDEFNGDKEALGRMLYEARYFNQYIGRKPKYVPLNVTALMTPLLPAEYTEKSLDIRKPGAKWFPSFGNVTGRLEARFFDAPLNEHMAALQIQYFRAILNFVFNSNKPIKFNKIFSMDDYERWKTNPEQWFEDASEHLKGLNLNPDDYKWLLWDSYTNRLHFEMRKKQYTPYLEFLPLKTATTKVSFIKLYLNPGYDLGYENFYFAVA